MKTQHDGDCTIYSSLINGRPEDGVCTCGYGWQYLRKNHGDHANMYSAKLKAKLEQRSTSGLEDKTKTQS